MDYAEDEPETNPEEESRPKKKSKVSVGLEKGTAAEGRKKAQEKNEQLCKRSWRRHGRTLGKHSER